MIRIFICLGRKTKVRKQKKGNKTSKERGESRDTEMVFHYFVNFIYT